MRKVFTIGELLIDFIPHETNQPLNAVKSFSKMPGGAPANVAVTIARLGGQSAFIGQVGNDGFGRFLHETVKGYNVDVSQLHLTNEAPTSLAFVTLDAVGGRDFAFYRNPGADQLLRPEQVDMSVIGADIVHFCSVSLSEHPIKKTHQHVLQHAMDTGAYISFDPNIRLPLFEDYNAYRDTIWSFIPMAHLLKVAEDELMFLTGEADESRAIARLFCGHVQHVVVTRGAKGASLFERGNKSLHVAGFKVNTIDTTGAGDAFIGALLCKLAHECLEEPNRQIPWKEHLRFANAVAAITTTRFGAMNAIPDDAEVANFMKGC